MPTSSPPTGASASRRSDLDHSAGGPWALWQLTGRPTPTAPPSLRGALRHSAAPLPSFRRRPESNPPLEGLLRPQGSGAPSAACRPADAGPPHPRPLPRARGEGAGGGPSLTLRPLPRGEGTGPDRSRGLGAPSRDAPQAAAKGGRGGLRPPHERESEGGWVGQSRAQRVLVRDGGVGGCAPHEGRAPARCTPLPPKTSARNRPAVSGFAIACARPATPGSARGRGRAA